MRHILIFDSKAGAEAFGRLIGGSYTFSSASEPDDLSGSILNDAPAAAVINADYAGGKLSEIIGKVKQGVPGNVPVIVSTEDNSCARQEYLCGCGADDVLIMPLCSRLVIKRLNLLTGTVPAVNQDKYCDFDKLIESVSEKTAARGSFCVEQNDFANFYRFVARGIERSEKSVQALMLTLSCNEDSDVGEEGIEMLSEAVKICLRKGDISSVCSKNQVVVLLIGADDNGGHLVANRIVSNFYSECGNGDFNLNYDIREVKRAK
ncbi:MAG: hypothetical protein IJX77_05880 [Ruminococcus sp.]|nr:hypothetical protein [Ruminococcus sp.]